ncbi:MAG TPA: serine/threonine-protein kinase [Gallionella sp.]|nr:serine/threonine-protein kinase [Gallionella sp.]
MPNSNLDKTDKLNEPHSPLIEDIDNYRITRVLGHGATSTVYLGVDTTSLKLVAIKKIRPECSIGIQHKMFEVEASLCGKLKHPNIVSLIEANVNDVTGSYIIMEYVEGQSLENFSTPDKLLAVETVMDIVRQAAEALNYAFQRGVIHRDVKPANIILRVDGLVKLSDFGCALLFDSETTQITGAGSLSYMSPEQIRGTALNHQSDIYSMGAVMYRLLTGHNTFKAADHYAAINQILNHPYIPMEIHRVGLPQEINRIVDRALQKNLEDRYQDWKEFLSDLYAASGVNRVESLVDDQTMFELMGRSAFFKDFLTVEIWEVLHASQWRTFKHNEEIIKDGEHGFSFYILLQGSVVVSKRQRMLNIIQAGDCVGENACLYNGSPIRGATVSAQGDVIALEVSRKQLEGFSKDVCIRMDRAFLRSLNEKLSLSNARVLQLMNL